jgi:hypothetical protein
MVPILLLRPSFVASVGESVGDGGENPGPIGADGPGGLGFVQPGAVL